MERTPEPEIMDDPAQALAYAEADFAEVNQAFVDALLSFVHRPEAIGHILDLGCGPADIPKRLCESLPHVHVTGIDGSEPMIALGRKAATKAGVEDRLDLRVAFLPTRVMEQPFNLIISNSLLHHLPDPAVIWDQIREQAAQGTPEKTEVYVMDLRRPADEAAAQEIVDTYAADEPDILRRDFYNSLLAAFTPEEVREQLVRAGLENLEIHLPTDRHLLVTGELGRN